MKYVLVLAVLCLLPTFAVAGNWNINCTNNSCVASQGRIQVYWMSNNMSNIYSGKLTGVEGLPINVKDWEEKQKTIDKLYDEVIPQKSEAKKDNKNDKTGFASSGGAENAEKPLQVDYTLSFVSWLGDVKHSDDRSIKRYWWAAEEILERYSDGSITPLVEQFLFSKNVKRLNELPINTPITDKNRKFVLTKWFAAKKLYPLDGNGSYSIAYAKLSDYGASDIGKKELETLFSEYNDDMQKIKLMLKPGMTAKKLYEKDRTLSMAKWLADKEVNEELKSEQLSANYMLAYADVNYWSKDEAAKKEKKEIFDQFEKAIKDNDVLVNKETIKGTALPNIALAGVGGIGAISAIAYLFFRRKKG